MYIQKDILLRSLDRKESDKDQLRVMVRAYARRRDLIMDEAALERQGWSVQPTAGQDATISIIKCIRSFCTLTASKLALVITYQQPYLFWQPHG